jgi:peptidoglycan/xylan/chitin deacetylase (PgdA/CDA1 family)
MSPESARPPVHVFLTVDTEIWPRAPGWPQVPLTSGETCERERAAYFWGGETRKRRGLPYQLETLRRHGLRATYFVDPLFSLSLGTRLLADVVGTIAGAGQEVGLHLHPEWLTDPRRRDLPEFAGPLLHQYGEQAQGTLVRAGLQLLADAGAPDIRVFRAGGWGANLATLRALASAGLGFDSSLNVYTPMSFPDLPDRKAWLQPGLLEGVWEFPVTSFVDRPPHGTRPLHVTACTFAEFALALEHAYAQGWFAVVIVLHSFEFVRVAALDRARGRAGPQGLLARRFERLCRYLSRHRGRFATARFADLSGVPIPTGDQVPARSNLARTVARQVSQLLSTVL